MVAVDELLQELNRYPTVNHILKTERGEVRSLPVLRRMARKRHVALEAALRECIASAVQVRELLLLLLLLLKPNNMLLIFLFLLTHNLHQHTSD